jgi:hypothetical protein
LPREAEAKGLAGAKRFTQFEILEGDPAWDGALTQPLGIATVGGADEVRMDFVCRFAPVLGDFGAVIVPEVGTDSVHGIFIMP